MDSVAGGRRVATCSDRDVICRSMKLRTSRLKRLVYVWVAAAVVLIVSIGETAAQSMSAETAARLKKILILHSYGREFLPWSEYAKAVRSELARQSPWPLDISDYPIVTARGDNDGPEGPFADYLHRLYDRAAPDLIVAMGAPAAGFAQRQRDQLDPAVPILFTAVDQRFVEQSVLSANDTAVAVNIELPPLFQNILQVLPNTKTVAVVTGDSPAERVWITEMRKDLKPFEDRINIVYWNDLSFEDILKRAATLPANSAIFWPQLRVDASGVVYEGREPLKRLNQVTSAPIFSYDDTFFDGETVGGPMLAKADVSRQAASVAVRILAGENPRDIKTAPIKYATPRYDWRQLQRWGISESSLPPGSTIAFREPTLWQRYSWQIALTLAIILVQAGLISGLLNANRRRRLAEVQSQQRMVELARVTRFSTAGELTGSIAHEINQPLGAILANAQAADAILESPTPDIAELKDIVKDILQDDQRATEVIRRMRSLLTKAPFELRSLDFNEVVRETTEFLSSVAVGRKVKLVIVMTPNALPVLGDRIQLQQVILNIVMNGIDAMRDMSSENRLISIQTSRVDNFAQLSVLDRGPGIPEDKLKEIFEPFFTSKAGGMGMGLSIARTIIEMHKGKIWAKNRDHGGAAFRIRLPLQRAEFSLKELSEQTVPSNKGLTSVVGPEWT